MIYTSPNLHNIEPDWWVTSTTLAKVEAEYTKCKGLMKASKYEHSLPLIPKLLKQRKRLDDTETLTMLKLSSDDEYNRRLRSILRQLTRIVDVLSQHLHNTACAKYNKERDKYRYSTAGQEDYQQFSGSTKYERKKFRTGNK